MFGWHCLRACSQAMKDEHNANDDSRDHPSEVLSIFFNNATQTFTSVPKAVNSPPDERVNLFRTGRVSFSLFQFFTFDICISEFCQSENFIIIYIIIKIII